MGIGIELGRAMMRQKSAQQEQQEREEAKRRQAEQDEAAKAQRAIQMAAMEAALMDDGASPENQSHRINLGGLSVQQTPTAPQAPRSIGYNVMGTAGAKDTDPLATRQASAPMAQMGGPARQAGPDMAPVETGALRPDVTRLSNGFIRDPNQTKEAKARAAAIAAERKAAQQVAQRANVLRTRFPELPDADRQAIASDETLYRQHMAPQKPKEPRPLRQVTDNAGVWNVDDQGNKVSRFGDRPATAGGTGQPRAITDGQRQVGALLPEIQEGHRVLSEMGSPEFLSTLKEKAGVWGNWTKTPEGQAYEQAANLFLNNLIYAKSGKGVTNDERDGLWKTYITVPGDSPKVRAAKERARTLAIQGLGVASGGPASPPDLSRF